MKTTYKQLIDFRTNATVYIQSVEGEKAKSKDPKPAAPAKVLYALKKLLRKTLSHFEDFQEKGEDIFIANASEDHSGNLLVAPQGGYSFTREAMKIVKAENRKELFKEVGYEPHYVDIPAGFDSELVEIFAGFIFSAEAVEAYEAQLFEEPQINLENNG